MKHRHNKKRNTAFLFEAAVRELTKSIVAKDTEKRRKILNILKEYSFNTVIACVQTFDNDTLKKTQRRIPKTPEQIYEFIKHANSLGLHTMSDIIFL